MLNDLVITDTSCLISLAKLNQLPILNQLYNKVFITQIILEEYGEILPDWIIIKIVNNPNQQKVLETVLDKGEASAICLALEIGNVILALDDLRARKEAKKLGLSYTGTLGILFKAKQLGYISSLKIELAKLKANGFYISHEIENELLVKSNEI